MCTLQTAEISTMTTLATPDFGLEIEEGGGVGEGIMSALIIGLLIGKVVKTFQNF